MRLLAMCITAVYVLYLVTIILNFTKLISGEIFTLQLIAFYVLLFKVAFLITFARKKVDVSAKYNSYDFSFTNFQ